MLVEVGSKELDGLDPELDKVRLKVVLELTCVDVIDVDETTEEESN